MNSSVPLLTIAIPTFNRIPNLRYLLSQLLPQICDGVVLSIHDNCSVQPVEEATLDLTSLFPKADVRHVRNKVNIGANANILRCFEMCESDWIWVVGDDDEVETGAVAVILERIREHQECLVLNFPIDNYRRNTRLTTGLEEFTEAIDPSADVPWITSTVYNVPEMIANIRFGYQYSFSMLPHVALLLMSFKPHHRCFFAMDNISSRDRAGAATDQQTPVINLALGYPVLLDLPIPLNTRRRLVQKLLVTSDSPGLPLRQLAYQLLLQSINSGERKNSLYIFDQACRRRFYFEATISQRLEILTYRTLLRLPLSLTAAAYRRLKGREITVQTEQDRLARL